jgi:predicted RNA-binding Zn-ribbon protein involved in translation (DUF1610 family)
MVQVLSDKIRRARTPHTCDQCQLKIVPGDRYRRQVCADGGLQTYRAHEDCDKAAQRYAELAQLDPIWDEPPNLRNDLCPEDYWWLLDEFPVVADRFGIQGPRHVR